MSSKLLAIFALFARVRDLFIGLLAPRVREAKRDLVAGIDAVCFATARVRVCFLRPAV